MVEFEGTLALKQHEDTGLFVIGYQKGDLFIPLRHNNGSLSTTGVPMAYKLHSKAKEAFDWINESLKKAKAADVQSETNNTKKE
jgi:hypothetical protein